MDARLEQHRPRPLRYDGEERRRSRAEYLGEERRAIDPPTEQDYPELFAPQLSEVQ
jgi:hypothetical protein